MCFPQQAISAQPCWKSLYGSLAPFKQCLVTDQFKSRQLSTINRYLPECRKLISWCNDVKVQFVLPMEPAVLAAYFSQLFRRNGSPNTLSMAYAALVWLHNTVNVTASYNPLKTGVCKNVVEAAKRSATQRKDRKLPISTDMVKTIVAKYGKVDANLKDLHISVIVLLGFAGFFRFKELANIRTSHMTTCLFLYQIVRQMSTGKAIRLLSLEWAMSLVQSI